MKIGIFGNCQAASYANAFQNKIPHFEFVARTSEENVSVLESCDLILQQNDYWHNPAYLREIKAEGRVPIVKLPTFYFPGFHPDLVIEHLAKHGALQSAAGSYNSSIVIYGYLNGLSIAQTIRLFDERVFDHLGFYGYYAPSMAHLQDNLNDCDLDGVTIVKKLQQIGGFAYSVNHFTPKVVEIIVDAMIERLGYKIAPEASPPFDLMKIHGKWPIYPPLGERLGIVGDYNFCFGPLDAETGERAPIDLESFVATSFEKYGAIPQGEFISQRLERDPLYKDLQDIVRPAKNHRSHVYSNLPETAYWKKSISERSVEEVDPVTEPRFKLSETDRIATGGSCFAQHIARTLLARGYNYHVVEHAPANKSQEWADARSYGLFSARYGNIYTARQLRQLIARSSGKFTPIDKAWQRPDGRFVDPFRPQLEPDGYETAADVERATDEHLRLVRKLFETTDVFVFTLGLTEAWASSVDGAVFPIAPGVIAGEMNFQRYEFRNFRIHQVTEDLNASIAALYDINPKIRIILTVSPVPLVATYESAHVLVATTYSKSVLRTAVEEAKERFSFVEYFPSYEIITGNYNMGRYFEGDKRSVNPSGVERVMRLLTRHYLKSGSIEPFVPTKVEFPKEVAPAGLMQEIASNSTILCDEETLER